MLVKVPPSLKVINYAFFHSNSLNSFIINRDVEEARDEQITEPGG